MSAFGYKRTFDAVRNNVRYWGQSGHGALSKFWLCHIKQPQRENENFVNS